MEITGAGSTFDAPFFTAAFAAYNAFTNGSGPLRLTGPVIARIFLGQITKWDDPAS